ncbi:MAG: hypothetical protein RLZZ422_1860 [Pseudomonadota bacterium]|jgi:cytochrome b
MKTNQLVWDFPTRAFHWLLALSFAGAYITSESERYRDIHIALGYVMGGLLLFRLVWGFVGSRYARFSDFTYPPTQVIRYLKNLLSPNPTHYVGHNPAGAWAIYLLLILGLTIVLSGVGLYWEVGGEEFAEDLFEELHEIAANLMLAVVLVHIAGVVISSVIHKENLPRSMVTGKKPIEASDRIEKGYPLLGALLVLSSLGFIVWYIMSQG